MVVFPNCKINIGLNIIARRKDGYHDIETVMFPVRGLRDVVEVQKSDKPGVEFTSSGLVVDGDPGRNLCVKAYNIIRELYGIGGVRMHLHKATPMGAGLGGGSADATFTIKALNDLFDLGLDTPTIENISARLGSDTPFFTAGRPVLASGRGEMMEPVGLDLSGRRLVILKPDIFVSTAAAFAGITPRKPRHPLRELIKLPVTEWQGRITNDFEDGIFALHPRLAQLKQLLYDRGADYASMSGSGSALYGIFPACSPELDWPEDVFVYQEIM